MGTETVLAHHDITTIYSSAVGIKKTFEKYLTPPEKYMKKMLPRIHVSHVIHICFFPPHTIKIMKFHQPDFKLN